MKTIRILFALAIIAALALFGFIYSGIYPIGADVPHARLTALLLDTLRERSIEQASAHIAVPSLDDAAMIARGAAEYEEMCSGCHLKPGLEDTELRKGLYPQPPNLTLAGHGNADSVAAAAEHFWVIKHGIKASGMPAWGLSHDDEVIWSIVAFLQKLPTLDAAQYSAMSSGESSHSHEHEHADSTDAQAGEGADSMAGTEPAVIVEQFQQALASGDTEQAAALLDPDVKVFESGGVERSRQEYAAHHLGADAEFLGQASVKLLSRSGDAVGDLAWVGSESRISAMDAAKPVELTSTETMVLRKGESGWHIVHIHWSSRPADPSATDH